MKILGKKYNFSNGKEEARVQFYRRYKNDGKKLNPEDKATFDELLKKELITWRGTDLIVTITNQGLVVLAKEEFDARCDLLAFVLRFIALVKEDISALFHLRRVRVK